MFSSFHNVKSFSFSPLLPFLLFYFLFLNSSNLHKMTDKTDIHGARAPQISPVLTSTTAHTGHPCSVWMRLTQLLGLCRCPGAQDHARSIFVVHAQIVRPEELQPISSSRQRSSPSSSNASRVTKRQHQRSFPFLLELGSFVFLFLREAGLVRNYVRCVESSLGITRS